MPHDSGAMAPLSMSAFHILLALANGEQHGYVIAKEIERETGGAVLLGPGLLYRTLKQLLDDRWIVEVERRDDDPRRRSYRITALGRRMAEGEARRLANLVRLVKSRHLWPQGA